MYNQHSHRLASLAFLAIATASCTASPSDAIVPSVEGLAISVQVTVPASDAGDGTYGRGESIPVSIQNFSTHTVTLLGPDCLTSVERFNGGEEQWQRLERLVICAPSSVSLPAGASSTTTLSGPEVAGSYRVVVRIGSGSDDHEEVISNQFEVH